MRRALASLILMAGAILAGCDRGADTGATANPVLPGRPGEGNPVVEATPRIDTSPVSPGIAPEQGKANVIPGTTGRGDSTPTVPLQPGHGTAGGLGGATPREQAQVPSGSPNTVPSNQAGQR